MFARALPDKQGLAQANRLYYLVGAASGVAGLATDSGTNDPELMTDSVISQAKISVSGQPLLGRHGELRFSS